MKTKNAYFRDGGYATFEKTESHDAPYVLRLWAPLGRLDDKIRLDDYREACAMWKSFKAIGRARAAKKVQP